MNKETPLEDSGRVQREEGRAEGDHQDEQEQGQLGLQPPGGGRSPPSLCPAPSTSGTELPKGSRNSTYISANQLAALTRPGVRFY